MFYHKTISTIVVVLIVLLSLGPAAAVDAGERDLSSSATSPSVGERASALQQTTTESEPNDDPTSANPVEPGAAIRGAISQPTDIDAFGLNAEAGQTIEANLSRTSGDGLFVLLIYGPDGTALSGVLAEPGAATQLSARANATGRYDVVVGSAGHFGVEAPNADGTGEYVLEVASGSVEEDVFTFPTEIGAETATTTPASTGQPTATPESPTTPGVPVPGTPTPLPTTTGGPSGTAIAESEPNEGPTAANGIALGDTVRGTLADANDVDWYRVELGADESVGLELTRPAGSGVMVFGVLVPSGEALAAGFVNGSETIELTADTVGAGTYYVLVGPLAENPGTGPYTLTVARSALLPDTLSEQEPNDSTQLATALTLDGTMSGTISDQNDVDVYALRMESGRSYNVTITRQTAGGTFGLSLVRPSGEFVSLGGSEVFSTPYVETYITYDSVEAGVFYLVVRAGDATGPYTVTMVEEPSTAADAARSAAGRADCPVDRNPYVAAYDDDGCVPTAAAE